MPACFECNCHARMFRVQLSCPQVSRVQLSCPQVSRVQLSCPHVSSGHPGSCLPVDTRQRPGHNNPSAIPNINRTRPPGSARSWHSPTPRLYCTPVTNPEAIARDPCDRRVSFGTSVSSGIRKTPGSQQRLTIPPRIPRIEIHAQESTITQKEAHHADVTR
jgi:hypothetical protein